MRYVHTNLIAKDCCALSLFYQKVFGCKPSGARRNLSGEWLERLTGLSGAHITGEHLLLTGGDESGPTLEIFSYSHEIEHTKGISNCGFSHIAFEVQDVRKTAEHVVEEGGALLGEIVTKEYEGVGLATFVYVRDPEGNFIELQSWDRI